jgi:hypothetical protein
VDAPGTPWGDPDLQGTYFNINELNIPMERPERFAGRSADSLTPTELAEFTTQSNEARRKAAAENAFAGLGATDRFDLRPSRAWLVSDPPDGRVPPLTGEGKRRQAAFRARADLAPDGATSFNLRLRCISVGLARSMLPSLDGAPYRIVQSPGVVVITQERLHEARVIPLDGRAPAPTLRAYLGYSRGRWDGDTLIVETSNVRGAFDLTSAASDNLRVVERFTPTPAGIEWSMTFDDASAWETPWTIAMRFAHTTETVFEDGCHEGNYFMRNVLGTARAEERRAR